MTDPVVVVRETQVVVVAAPGPQGPPGASAGFVYPFGPASSVTVPHNLHRKPNVSFVALDGSAQIADVTHIDVDHAYLAFPGPVTGEVVCT